MAKYNIGDICFIKNKRYRISNKNGCGTCDLPKDGLCVGIQVLTNNGAIDCVDLIGENYSRICFKEVKTNMDILNQWRKYDKNNN